MSTFTKKTVITWSKASYDSMLETGTPESPNPVMAELHAKKDEMISSGTMSEEAGGFVKESGATQFRKFTDQASAQEWIDFNSTLATTHNLTLISATTQSI